MHVIHTLPAIDDVTPGKTDMKYEECMLYMLTREKNGINGKYGSGRRESLAAGSFFYKS